MSISFVENRFALRPVLRVPTPCDIDVSGTSLFPCASPHISVRLNTTSDTFLLGREHRGFRIPLLFVDPGFRLKQPNSPAEPDDANDQLGAKSADASKC